eukprot:2931091-Rhodomonas_salina.1
MVTPSHALPHACSFSCGTQARGVQGAEAGGDLGTKTVGHSRPFAWYRACYVSAGHRVACATASGTSPSSSSCQPTLRQYQTPRSSIPGVSAGTLCQYRTRGPPYVMSVPGY